MTRYTVKGLAELAGVSVKTLHHYHKIGLLKPSGRSEKGYRYYTKDELIQLQQILFYKELDFTLNNIKEILNAPAFDILKALEYQKKALNKRAKRMEQLLKTLDKTIVSLKKNETMKDEELYKGFSKEQVEVYRKEVTERWGADELRETEEKIKAMGSKVYDDVQQQGEEINLLLASLMDLEPYAKQVQEAVALHHKYLNHFREVTPEGYLGLGKMYTEDERFSAYYEKYREGLTNFLYEAIKHYCKHKV